MTIPKYRNTNVCVCVRVYSRRGSRLALAPAALYAKMYTAEACSHSLAEKIEAAVTRYLTCGESDDESDDEQQEELFSEQRNPVDYVALVSLQESKLVSIDMQAKGLACLQSIVFESPAKFRSDASVPNLRRLQEWPAEVSCFQKFCMELYKPIETGFDMLSLILRYSPRAWHQTEKYRAGLKSVAKEFWRSFLRYTASVSSEAEVMSWLFAFNYHAKRRGLRCTLEFTPAGRTLSQHFQLKFGPKTPKRKRSTMPSDGEQDELTSLYQSISTSNHFFKAHEAELKEICDAFKCLYTSKSVDKEHQPAERRGRQLSSADGIV